ncbi:site-specific integrase [Anaerotignum sp. MB30-C6]|uniref:site-specific integrase n=1 Tax=Anaerotignum sp. MB30-C6 TaxID=3070814 RepID=UPI0027DD7A11|nr:site-specific integrase [Anaerotignum sp. MB30-C6]WMI80954.1 tyrosine-type recombinase/integrase [Anaerotignum sp. MB30-C6]
MAKAKKLPSGSWTCLVYSHNEMVDGKEKRKYQRFTATTQKEAEYLAAEFMMNKDKRRNPENFTVKEAIENYIETKKKTLSPSTIRAYSSLAKYHYDEIDIPIAKINNDTLQKYFNKASIDLTPKTVRNMSGLLSATLKFYHPDFYYNVTMPTSKKEEITVPCENDLKKIIELSKGSTIHLPVLIASGMGLRRGEIAALRVKDADFENNTIAISFSMVFDKDKKEWVRKPPKTTAGKRVLPIPSHILPVLEEVVNGKKDDDSLTGLTPTDITNHFFRFLLKHEINHMRFHDLRHYYASMMLANNVPDKYALKRMGHATDNMLKRVYQHTMKEKDGEVTKTIDSYLVSVFGEQEQ